MVGGAIRSRDYPLLPTVTPVFLFVLAAILMVFLPVSLSLSFSTEATTPLTLCSFFSFLGLAASTVGTAAIRAKPATTTNRVRTRRMTHPFAVRLVCGREG